MMAKKMLLLTGGLWHDFMGFGKAMKDMFEPMDWSIEFTEDYQRLLRLNRDGIHLVMSYTCFSQHRPGMNDMTPDRLSDVQIDALEQWVYLGGGLLSVHSGTVLGESSQKLARLLGGEFITHPPQFEFTVYPLDHPHPCIEGVESFTVLDEFYVQKYDSDVQLHMIATYEGKAYPMAWSKEVGKGKVAHIAPGHAANVWNHLMFQKLLSQTVDWLTKPLALPGFLENTVIEREP
jgi:type 1 glutamine amidotransferase